MHPGNLRIVAACLFVLALSSCAKHKQARVSRTPQPPARIGSTQRGEASWYGEPYHGRRTASGEVYDMEQLTAAHRTLPFQTWVEVTNLDNGKQVDVRITDRGPFIDNRIIDLSRGAARMIDLLRTGIAPVRLRVIEAKPLPPSPELSVYVVQLGAFADRLRAEAVRSRVNGSRLMPTKSDPPLWRVWIGEHLTRAQAEQLAAESKSITGQSTILVEDPD
jgi:rare lipoprotein A